MGLAVDADAIDLKVVGGYPLAVRYDLRFILGCKYPSVVARW